MTAAQTTSVTTQLPAAASAIAQSWGLGDAFVISDPIADRPDLAFAGQAVLVQFSGRVSGELALVVDAEIAQQLMDSPAAPADLIAALAPATTAACLAVGDITVGASQVLDPALATEQVLGHADSGYVTLSDDGEVRVLVAIGQFADTEGPQSLADTIPSQARGAGSPSTTAAPSTSRLDLLRGVQMQATVELGRTTMTINDLLALRSGTVIELDRAAGAPADLYVNGRLIAHGEVVVVDENYGLRILKVVADEVTR